MMKSLQVTASFLIAFLLLFPGTSFAGSDLGLDWGDVPPDSVSPWNLELTGALNGSQASYSNWQQGGVNTLSVAASTVFNARYRKKEWGYALRTNLAYGQAKIDDEYRKTDDVISIRNRFRRFFPDDRWSIVLDINFISQFDIGKDRDLENTVSRFLAPGYLTESIGISYQPVEYFSVDSGVALKQTFVRDTNLSERYGLDPGDTFRNEAGLNLQIQFEKDILENVRFLTSVETFSNLNRSLTSTDVNYKAELIGRINNFLTTNFQFQAVYNDDVSKEVQLRQVLSVGLNFRII